MSTLKVDTIQNVAGGSASTPLQLEQGRAKAWVNFNGTGVVAIRDSYNVSSITDNGIGDYTVNFTTALNNANYTVIGSAGSSGVSACFRTRDDGTARTTSLVRVSSFTAAAGEALTDCTFVEVIVFGDQ